MAMFALGAIMAIGASAALPEVGQCQKWAQGKYENAECTVKAQSRKTQGHYEWQNAEQVEAENGCTNCGVDHFEVNGEHDGRGAIGPTTFETTGGHEIVCADTRAFFGEEAETEFKLAGRNAVTNVLVNLTNCKEAGGEEKECYSPGWSNEGEGEGGTITDVNQWLENEGIKGKLEILAGKATNSPTVGLVLTAEEPKSENNERKRLLTAECEGKMGTVWIGGETKGKNGMDEILALISPADVDHMTKTLTTTFSQTKGIQEPAALESGKPRFLEAFLKNGWEQLGWASTSETVSREGYAVEIKAIL
jgi:hypothetical protein